MRRVPRVWQGGGKQRSRTMPQRPPQCSEVSVEVFGVSPGLQRIDIVADTVMPVPAAPEPEPVPERWASIDEAIEATRRPSGPDPWDRLTR